MTAFGGPWTQQKLDILKGYLDAYTTALKNQSFQLTYVDAFAGDGSWRPGLGYDVDDYGDFAEMVQGSAAIALQIDDKPFDRFVFIERDPQRALTLNQLRIAYQDRDIRVINNDANVVLPDFCDSMSPNDRAVVFLDPFATQVDWQSVEKIAQTRKIDCWILFPRMAVNRIMPTANEPRPEWAARLDVVFGGREHWQTLYQPSAQMSLFGDEPNLQRESGGNRIPQLYRDRLTSAFTRVAPTQRELRNSRNVAIFDLFFAAGNPVGAPIAVRIADHILSHW